MTRALAALFADRAGHIAIEYGMIAALVVIGLMVAIGGMGTSVESMLGKALPALNGPTP